MPNQRFTQSIMWSLWSNWAITTGAIAMSFVLPFLINKIWLPLPIAFMAYLLLNHSYRTAAHDVPGCVLVLRVGVLTLFWSAAVMVIINTLNSHMLLDGMIDWSNSNREVPYITSLIVLPIAAIISIWELARGESTGFCRRCKSRNGFTEADSSVMLHLYSRESRYQVHMILVLSAALTVIQYWYYFAYYININLNTPDLFFFRYMPISVYAISLYFMYVRYNNIGYLLGPLSSDGSSDSVKMRYLVISGDKLLLGCTESGRWDTPATCGINTLSSISEERAMEEFIGLSNLDNIRIRYLFGNRSANLKSQILHYAVFIKDDSESKGNLDGEWVTLDIIDRLLKTARLSTELANEIYRIYTVTMAWKTYTRDGLRNYPIKNYRPTFRLRDFKDWDVDYDDGQWLNIAANNEDRPFFRIRRLWHRITGAIQR